MRVLLDIDGRQTYVDIWSVLRPICTELLSLRTQIRDMQEKRSADEKNQQTPEDFFKKISLDSNLYEKSLLINKQGILRFLDENNMKYSIHNQALIWECIKIEGTDCGLRRYLKFIQPGNKEPTSRIRFLGELFDDCKNCLREFKYNTVAEFAEALVLASQPPLISLAALNDNSNSIVILE